MREGEGTEKSRGKGKGKAQVGFCAEKPWIYSSSSSLYPPTSQLQSLVHTQLR